MTLLTDVFSAASTTGQRLRLLHIEDQKSSSTHGGTFTSGAWRTRDLNTVVTNEITGASLSSNQVTLPAGNYFIEASTPSRAVLRNSLKIVNITDTVDLLYGQNSFNDDGSSAQESANITGKIILDSTKIIELQHLCQATTTNDGFGTNVGSAISVNHETYTVVKIWQILDSRALPQQAELFHVQQQETSGTSGGTFTAGSWQTRTLNTIVSNAIAGASISSNQVTLPAGKYLIEAYAIAYHSNRHKAKLYNITDATDILLGSSQYNWTTDGTDNQSFINGEFTLNSPKVLEVQHQGGNTKTTNGFGNATSFGTEIYVDVRIWKIG